jgi:hypothetical protein
LVGGIASLFRSNCHGLLFIDAPLKWR